MRGFQRRGEVITLKKFSRIRVIAILASVAGFLLTAGANFTAK